MKLYDSIPRLRTELDALGDRHELRCLEDVRGINLCSNDYLGLSEDERLRDAIMVALNQGESLCSTGSRLLSGNAPAWDRLEIQLAAFIGTDASLYYSSGYLANLGLLSALLGDESVVFSDSSNHASIIDGIRLSRARKEVFPHSDLNFLESALRADSKSRERFIVVESIFSMDGDRAPLMELYALADRYDAKLIVDEAHATGVVGPLGRGLVAATGRPDCVIATMHTCGKALASMGAFVACSGELRQYLINRSREFIFTTALAPYVAAQTSESVRVVASSDDRRTRLQELSVFLRKELQKRGFDVGASQSNVVPVILGSSERAVAVSAALVHVGFGVKAVRPPTVPAGSARLRLSLTSRHSMADLQSFVEALAGVC